MNLDDIRGTSVDVETLPDEIHMQLTIHKLANELMTINTQLEKLSEIDDIKQIHYKQLRIRLHITHLLATMIHLFEWIDFGDIIDKNNFRKYMEEYLLFENLPQEAMPHSVGMLKQEKEE